MECSDKPYKTYAEYLRHPKFLKIRNEVLKRDCFLCRDCNTKEATEVHHLRYPTWGTFDVPDNLVAICHKCHCKRHGVDR